MRTLYIDAGVARELPAECCVVAVPPLLRQLILRAMTIGLDYRPEEPQARIMTVILDELRALKPEPLYLPHPRDVRLKRIAEALLADPADHRSEEHTSELQSLMRISYAVFCLKKKNSKPAN